MAATATVTLTMPKRTAGIIARKAMAENVSVSEAILGMIEDALDDDPISEAEARHLIARAERNEEMSKGKRLYTHEEFWKLADNIPYDAGR